MNFHINGMEKTVTELYGMLKTTKDSIKKNPNHVMMAQKEKKKWKHWTPSKGKDKEKVSDEPSSSKPKQKASLTLLLMRNASTATRRDIGLGTVRSTWRSRRRRKVRLLLQV
jgi:acyl-CoA-binding protein